MNSDFQRRCASALTHPATVAAVVVLLVNDVALKALWPDSWFTGKLSDLAWIVFASPLLAFALSPLAGRRPALQRAAFVAAYAGLPALYAAFNTFQPLHDFISRVLNFASGASAVSPMDATDSLVIPMGLAVAAWVWARPAAAPGRLRMRLALLAAAVMAFATVATAGPDPVPDGLVGQSHNGTVYLRLGTIYGSIDGGLNWLRTFDNALLLRTWEDGQIDWGGSSVTTPRGDFAIEGSNIVRTVDGNSEVVYTPPHLRNESNTRFQNFVDGGYNDECCPSATPRSLVYHSQSGNIVVAAWTQGVVVGDGAGNWKEVAINPYHSPTDFSSDNKLRSALLETQAVWWVAVTTSVSATVAAFALSGLWAGTHRYADWGRVVVSIGMGAIVFWVIIILGKDQITGTNGVTALIAANVLVWATSIPLGAFALFSQGQIRRRIKLYGVAIILGTPFMAAATLFVLLELLSDHREIPVIVACFSSTVALAAVTQLLKDKTIVVLSSSALSVIAGATAVAVMFPASVTDSASMSVLPEAAGTVAASYGLVALFAIRPPRRQWPIIGAAMLVFIVCFMLAFAVGVARDFDLTAAKLYAGALTLVAVVVVVRGLRWARRSPRP